MIDDPRKTDLLMSMLTESLPIEANVTPYLAGELMEQPKLSRGENSLT